MPARYCDTTVGRSTCPSSDSRRRRCPTLTYSSRPLGGRNRRPLRDRLTWMTAELGGVTPTRGETDRPDAGTRWTVGDRRATHPAPAPAPAARRYPVRR